MMLTRREKTRRDSTDIQSTSAGTGPAAQFLKCRAGRELTP